MEIIKGKYSGFCAGVNYTYTKAKEVLEKESVYCLGEIIHNEHVIQELENLGMITVDEISKVPDNSKVIFRAHGEAPGSYDYALNHHIEVIDLTCPNVKAIHNKVLDKKDNYYVILIGKKSHPEVLGTIGYCDKSFIIETEDDIKLAYEDIKKYNIKNIYIVSQTTFSSDKFDKLVSDIRKLFTNYNIEVDKTICNATEKRQKEAVDLSNSCNKILVIGSKKSSNTKELYNIAINICPDTFFVEDENDLRNIQFKDLDKIGILAGASVPNHIIDNILKKLT